MIIGVICGLGEEAGGEELADFVGVADSLEEDVALDAVLAVGAHVLAEDANHHFKSVFSLDFILPKSILFLSL